MSEQINPFGFPRLIATEALECIYEGDTIEPGQAYYLTDDGPMCEGCFAQW